MRARSAARAVAGTSYQPADAAGQARDIVDTVRPGSIILAHDVGDRRRLVALRALRDIVSGLKGRGFEFVTVSDLIADVSTNVT